MSDKGSCPYCKKVYSDVWLLHHIWAKHHEEADADLQMIWVTGHWRKDTQSIIKYRRSQG